MMRRYIVLALLLIVLAGLLFGRLFARQIGWYLVTSDLREPSGAIVVLGGGDPDRILGAVDRYRQGYAPLIVLSTEERITSAYNRLDTLGITVPERHDISRFIAEQQGVPPNAILVRQQPGG